jgi:hypothetical protein
MHFLPKNGKLNHADSDFAKFIEYYFLYLQMYFWGVLAPSSQTVESSLRNDLSIALAKL